MYFWTFVTYLIMKSIYRKPLYFLLNTTLGPQVIFLFIFFLNFFPEIYRFPVFALTMVALVALSVPASLLSFLSKNFHVCLKYYYYLRFSNFIKMEAQKRQLGLFDALSKNASSGCPIARRACCTRCRQTAET